MLSAGSAALAQSGFREIENGIIVTPASGSEKAVRLQVYGDSIIRVSSAPTADLNFPSSLMVTARPVNSAFKVTSTGGTVTLRTDKVSADVELANGNVTFRDAAGQVLLAESAPASFTTTT